MPIDFSRPQVLECPSCGATLALPDADTFLCDYCGKRIIVPPELRPHRDEPPPVSSTQTVDSTIPNEFQPADSFTRDDSIARQQKARTLLVISLSIGLLLIGLLGFFVFFSFEGSTGSGSILPLEIIAQPTASPTPIPYASLALVFGSEGSRPGQFDDARSIAVDNEGNIFVADYTSGRINKFDPDGNFLQLIRVGSPAANRDYYIPAIAADQLGNLYVATSGQILKYSSTTGKLLLTMPDRWPEIYFDSVVVAPDGNLYSTNGMAGADDVVIQTPEGELLAHWTDLIESINHDDPALSLALAVNSSGSVFLLSPFGNQVYRYNPDGTFHLSFGEEGDNPGQFSLSTGLIAVNHLQELVISDVYRVDIFDENGNYLGKSFTVDYQVAGGSIYGMTIDSSDNLYFITSGGKVLKFTVN
jgi:outer membrane protein assembly factor BamB